MLKRMKKKRSTVPGLFDILLPVMKSDGRTGADETAELYLLFVTTDTPPAERQAILRRLLSGPEPLPDSLPSKKLSDFDRKFLAKELTRFIRFQSKRKPELERFLSRMGKTWKLGEKMLASISQFVDMEEKVVRYLAGDLAVDRYEFIQKLASDVSGVALPLGILYAAGQTGFSAAGIASGLASLGTLTGLAIFSPMVGGMIFLILLGSTTRQVFLKGIIPKLSGLLMKVPPRPSSGPAALILALRTSEYLACDIDGLKDLGVRNWRKLHRPMRLALADMRKRVTSLTSMLDPAFKGENKEKD